MSTPSAKNDILTKNMATVSYDKKRSLAIDRCQLHLQVISLYDLLLNDLTAIHPSFLVGERPPSTNSIISFDWEWGHADKATWSIIDDL
jgi:hypothetical protein